MLLGAVAGVALLGVSSAQADPPLTECQKRIGDATKTHFDAVYNVMHNCFKQVMDNLDCNAVSLLDQLDQKRLTLRRKIAEKCTDANLTTLGFEEGDDLDDTTEEPGTIQIRELSDAIVRSNSLRVTEALILAYPCEASTINLGPTSHMTLQGPAALATMFLSGSVELCYATLNGITGATATTGRHVLINRKQELDPVVLSADLYVCVEASGVSAGFINCDGDKASRTGRFLTSTDHVLNQSGSGMKASENFWDWDSKICNAGGPPWRADLSLTDCQNFFGGTELVSPQYWGQRSTSNCSSGSLPPDIATSTKPRLGTVGISCLEADSDGTTGHSSGDGTDYYWPTAGAGCNSNSNSGGAIHLADQGDATACNGPTDVRGSGKTCKKSSCPAGTDCVIAADCWCGDFDPGVALCGTQTGMGAGDAVMLNTIALKLKNPQLGECGSDGSCCTEDDQFLGTLGAPQGVVTTTIHAEGLVADADATANGQLIAPGQDCGTACLASIDGAAASCAHLAAGNPSGLELVGAFVSVDGTSFNDMVVTFSYVAP